MSDNPETVTIPSTAPSKVEMCDRCGRLGWQPCSCTRWAIWQAEPSPPLLLATHEAEATVVWEMTPDDAIEKALEEAKLDIRAFVGGAFATVAIHARRLSDGRLFRFVSEPETVIDWDVRPAEGGR